ncbi:MAG: gamma-glutamyl-gamma-aminobutyrate hydrolase family protein, partial [Thermoguttaceae bacterium]
MVNKPLIGINADFRPTQKGSPALSYVFSGYYDSVLRAGGLPVIIPPFPENKELERNLDQLLCQLDGVVLTGGADLDPRRDGYMLHPTVNILDERRETFDRFLVEKIIERRMPVFGIGTGMQLINVALGGTLFLHIPEDMPKALPHRDTMDPNHRHGLLIEKNSLLERVYGDNDIRVNSMHHMSIDDVAPGFWITGRCPDGVVEVIESIKTDWFAIGTQFHPEHRSATALDQGIFREFI